MSKNDEGDAGKISQDEGGAGYNEVFILYMVHIWGSIKFPAR